MSTSVKRWVPFASVPIIAVAAAIAIPLSTNAAQDLPEKTPSELLAFVAESDVSAFSGDITQTSDLGLPDLSALGGGGDLPTGEDGASFVDALVELATASHDARVFLDEDHGARLQVLDRLAERNVVASEDGVWIYDSSAKTATHILPPEGTDAGEDAGDDAPPADVPTPSSVADDLIASLDESTVVSVGSTATVAGRSAYELVLTPRDEATLVGDVTISVDGETGLPLGVDVTARGADSAAFSLAYSSIDFSAPDPALFDFTPPAGTEVTEHAAPEKAPEAPEGAESGTSPVDELGLTTTGSDWGTIVELPAGDAPVSLEGLEAVTTAVDGGRALSSALVSVLITDDGRVLAGAVPVDVLVDAAAR